MLETILYGLTIGAILYFFSIGLSLTFGTMHIINFAHGMVYTLGVYVFIATLKLIDSFVLSLIFSMLALIPIAWGIERYIIRRLYGASLHARRLTIRAAVNCRQTGQRDMPGRGSINQPGDQALPQGPADLAQIAGPEASWCRSK